MRVAVIGAGPAGLTAAFQLQQAGMSVELFEAGPSVGGMAGSMTLWGHRVDFGPHRFFSRDDKINRFWHDFVAPGYVTVDRTTRIFYRGKFFDYPLRPGNVLANLGIGDAIQCAASYLRERFSPSTPEEAAGSFEAWVVTRFGRRLYEMFFKSYSEKLWGIPCRELDADFAAQRIRGFSFAKSVLAMAGLGGKPRTLTDCFPYPLGGSGEVYERMADRFAALGGRLHLSTPVAGVMAGSGRVDGIVLADGQTEIFDHVVSTMPLTLLVKQLAGADNAAAAGALAAPLQGLRFRNTILVYLKVEATGLFPDQWIYVHAPELAVGRMTNYSNWAPQAPEADGSTVLSLEYWCYDDDPIWRDDSESLIARAKAELRALGIAGTAAVTLGHVVRVPRCYPVYARGYAALLEPVVQYLRGFANLWPIGRYGAFKYNNQDHSILMGLLAAENIAGGATHDLWGVNTDYDEYQENAVRSAAECETPGRATIDAGLSKA
jgi:protoporphyrinogen oxidase